MLTSSPSDLTINDLLKGDLQLTSPPAIYFELKKIVEDPSKSMADAAFVIEKDAAVALKLMKIVNSAYYGFPSRIASVERAVTIIGTAELQNLVLGAVIIERFSNLPGNIMTMHDFWAKSLKCALISRELDAYLGGQYRDSVFLCGLFHDIGQLVFFRRIPELAREVELIRQSRQNLEFDDEILIEEDIIGFNHFQAGAVLCRLWNLPEVIVESIRLHNYPDNTDQNYMIAAIARLANYHCKLEFNHDGVIANSLGISAPEMAVILEKAFDQFADLFNLFYSPRTC